MSRVRIYELAKEAGLKSKELADKLIAMGYPIKGHSSTVDEDMATDIRRKVLGQGKVEVRDEHIHIKKRSSVAGKKTTTVVRRRSKAQKDAAAQKLEEAIEAESVEQEVEAVDVESAQVEEPAESPVSDDVVDDGVLAEEVTSEAVDQEDVAEAEVSSSTGEEVAEEREAVAETVKEVKKTEEPKRSKSLAKVVGQVKIHIPEKKSRPPRRPVRPKPGAPRQVAPPAGVADGRGPAKGKKKGKRVVAIQNDDSERSKKAARGGKKGRRRIDFSRGGDVEFMRPRRGRRKKDRSRRESTIQPPAAEMKAIKKRIKVVETISLGELAKRMGVKASEVIGKLMGLGVMATVNQALDVETAILVASDFGYEVEQA